MQSKLLLNVCRAESGPILCGCLVLVNDPLIKPWSLLLIYNKALYKNLAALGGLKVILSPLYTARVV